MAARDRYIVMLISLLVLLLIVGLVYWAITTIPLPQPIRVIAIVILVIVAVVYLLGYLPGGHLPRGLL